MDLAYAGCALVNYGSLFYPRLFIISSSVAGSEAGRMMFLFSDISPNDYREIAPVGLKNPSRSNSTMFSRVESQRLFRSKTPIIEFCLASFSSKATILRSFIALVSVLFVCGVTE
ncbi:MAG: hypothetical protein EZS28_038743 [Streblomastix strix]|uniref:Uncharacterized protein n=1 Tax=Streblomastix strix TaxID=222440 RepID=A0A5J4U694_9EUKA|nr:MAG: hypothetical protein EZS28_038743 [Streblomastix strix]